MVSEGDEDLPGRIKEVALRYNLVSDYTAFVAVDASRRTDGDSGVSILVPVPVPDGVRYDTTVGYVQSQHSPAPILEAQ